MNSLQPLEGWYRRSVDGSLTTLDKYVKAVSLPRLDLLKADVEGAELHVLEGGQETLKRLHPHLILEFSLHSERFGYEPADLLQYLDALDYRTFIIQAMQLSRYKAEENDRKVFNVLAVHESAINSLQEKGVLAATDN
jgi:hypothetical protein